jgi:hypothetical protein
MPGTARRAIRDSCDVLERDRECLSFWTINLPDDAHVHLAITGRWAAFVREVRRLLVRRLKRRGLCGDAVAAIELHPVRSSRMDWPLPHLHIVYKSKPHRWARWALSPRQHDALVARSLRIVGCTPASLASASTVCPVNKSCSRYLSSYLKKGSKVFLPSAAVECLSLFAGPPRGTLWLAMLPLLLWVWETSTALIPRQWWFRTGSLKAAVEASCVWVPTAFACWIVSMGPLWVEAAGGEWFLFETADGRGPPVVIVDWPSAAVLAAAVAQWDSDATV